MEKIEGFFKENFYLSNYYTCDIPIKMEIKTETSTKTQTFWFSNAEAAFQAFKVFRNIDSPTEVELIDFLTFIEYSAPEARTRGRNWKKSYFNIDYWNSVKDRVMERILRIKFLYNKNLYKKLLSTGDAYLEETNTWHDTYWGVCDGKGENNLGKLLMKLRDEWQKKEK